MDNQLAKDLHEKHATMTKSSRCLESYAGPKASAWAMGEVQTLCPAHGAPRELAASVVEPTSKLPDVHRG